MKFHVSWKECDYNNQTELFDMADFVFCNGPISSAEIVDKIKETRPYHGAFCKDFRIKEVEAAK